ncbi:MAG TPA: hypothetical protein VGM64_03740 [Lacunisphaera sp.]
MKSPAIRLFALLASTLTVFASLQADPLTKQLDIDFGRDVASRNLKGLATRSDGRVLPGPVFTDLDGPKLGEILWTMKSAGANRFIVGTGPEGKVQQVTFNPKDNSYSVKEIADVKEPQAISVLPLPGGDLLVGTSPTAAVYLVRDGKNIARVPLPADSVFDFLPMPDGAVLAATGNPGKIYRLDLKKLTKAGVIEGKISDDRAIADKGVTVFGEIRDSNVRKLACLADGRIIAGSSPKGNVYSFGATGGAPVILQENHDSEVVDLMPMNDGTFYAGIVLTAGDSIRIGKVAPPKDDAKEEREPKPAFSGRTSVVHFPVDGFPETVVTKTGIALYRLGQYKDWLLLTAGEQGDAFAYDPVSRRSLTFAGSSSSQLNDIAALGDGRYLLLRNNAPGLALMSFVPAKTRELETKRLDLGVSAELGAFRFSRLRGIELSALKLEVRTNFGSDEIEGWSPWTAMKLRDGGFYADDLRGRYVRFRLQVSGEVPDLQIDKATLFNLPQNRRPTLIDFRIFSPNLALIPAADQPPSATTTLSQLIYPSSRDDGSDKRKGSFMSSQIVPQTGSQLVYWTVSDADGDNLAYTFSIRAENSDTWVDLAVNSPDNYLQFDTGGLAEGIYLTRLTASEQSPRPVKNRLTYFFETDNLLVDRTPPVITANSIKRSDGSLLISIDGRDELSLLEGVEYTLNNGVHETVVHPADGILDGKQETFVAEIPEARAAGATSVEVVLYDQAGNSSSIRLPLK